MDMSEEITKKIIEEITEKIKNKSVFLNEHFKGHQGVPLEEAEYIIFGLDANFTDDFDEELSQETKEKFETYFKDSKKFIQKNGIHSPLLLHDYKNGSGRTYHDVFHEICEKAGEKKNDANFANQIKLNTCFIEVLDFPTKPLEKDESKNKMKYCRMLLKKDKILKNFNKILSSDRKSKVFITASAADLIKPVLKKAGIEKELINWLDEKLSIDQEYIPTLNFKNAKIFHRIQLFSHARGIYTDTQINAVAALFVGE